jgi:hypothetical protein
MIKLMQCNALPLHITITMGGGKGKKDVNAKFYKHTEIQNKPPKTKSADSFAKSTVSKEKPTISDAKPTITDAKPTVIH